MPRAKKKVEPVVEEITAEEAVDILEEEIKEEEPAKKMGIVKGCGLLNVREKPTTNARAIRQISVNTKVEILGEEDGFYKINDGYVMSNFIDLV